jgi:RND family efflux transporter MFP subunit
VNTSTSDETIARKLGEVVLCLALLAFAGGCANEAEPESGPPEVMVTKVTNKRVADWDEFTGQFEAIDTVQVRARASGYIEKVEFKEGQMVKKGDVLLVIDRRPYQAEYDRARAGLALAQSQRELAEVEAERVKRLKDSGAVSREEIDRRQSALKQQEASVAAAKAAVDSAELLLSFTKVTAPVDGRTSRADVTRGNLVTGGNDGGTLLTTIVSVDPIHVIFEGDENAYLRYQAMARNGERSSSRDQENPVRVGLADEQGFPHVGYMNFVDNQLNVATGTIRGRAVLPNTEGRFTPGMFARVQLLGSAEHEAILVEERAIGTDQSQQFVLLVGKGNILEYRAVELGRQADGMRIVRKGLKPGDVIVATGSQRLRPGLMIAPKLTDTGSMAVAADTTVRP